MHVIAFLPRSGGACGPTDALVRSSSARFGKTGCTRAPMSVCRSNVGITDVRWTVTPSCMQLQQSQAAIHSGQRSESFSAQSPAALEMFGPRRRPPPD